MKNNKKKAENPINLETIGFQIRESYKTARTNIAYSIIKKGCKKIAFTSAMKGEGKTVTAVNVAIALAQQVDTRVLVVECDLRRPRVHKALGVTPAPGITNYLNDECSESDIVMETGIDSLYAICYGAIPPNPSELLASNLMSELIKRLENEYDYIIFDCPPIGVVIDSVPIVKEADGVVIVVKHNSTTYPQYNKTVDVLKRSGAKIVGVIMNSVDPIGSKKYGYGKGKGYGYNYGYGYGY